MAFTKVLGPGIHTLANVTSHNINSSGVVTATKFVGPFDTLSGDYITGIAATFTGNVSIGGTLTYMDVTNVDAVGIITAQEGIHFGIGATAGKFLASTGITTIASLKVGNLTSGNVTYAGSGGELIDSSNLTFNGSDLLIDASTNAYKGVKFDNSFNLTFGSSAGTSPRLYLKGTSNGEDDAGDIFLGTGTGGEQWFQSNTFTAFKVNADSTAAEALRITSAALVGIVTDSPYSTLTVYGENKSDTGSATGQITAKDNAAYNASPTGGLVFQGHYHSNRANAVFGGITGFKENETDGNYAGALAFHVRADGAAAYEALRISSAGKVGIGTTIPKQPVSIVKGRVNVDIQGDYYGVWFDGDSTGENTVKVGRWHNTGGEIASGITAYGHNNLILQNNNQSSHNIVINPLGAKVAIGTHVTDGLVHIGQTSAGSVSANAGGDELVLESSGNTGMSILSPSTGESSIFFGNPGTNGERDGYIRYWHESHATTGNRRCLTFHTGGGDSERLRIDSTGLVGIGTITPGERLDINGSMRLRAGGNWTTYATRITSRLDSTHMLSLEAYHNSSTPVEVLGTYADGGGSNMRMVLAAGGEKVGINTTNPDETLELFKPSGTNIVKVSTEANSTIGIELEKTGATTQSWRIADGQTVNGTLEFYDKTEGETRLAIDGSSRVIIGQASHAGGGALVVCGNSNTPNAYSSASFCKIGANPTSGTTLANLRFNGGTGGTNRAAEINVKCDANWAEGSSQASKMELGVADSGGTTANTPSLTLKAGGNVEINRGDLVMANGFGIDFGAQTSSPQGGVSTDNERFDHYEEGDWTPEPIITHQGGSGALSSIQDQYGRYVRSGNLVRVWFYFKFTASAITNCNVGVSGLPFTISNDAEWNNGFHGGIARRGVTGGETYICEGMYKNTTNINVLRKYNNYGFENTTQSVGGTAAYLVD